jgi:hypothetical protein
LLICCKICDECHIKFKGKGTTRVCEQSNLKYSWGGKKKRERKERRKKERKKNKNYIDRKGV